MTSSAAAAPAGLDPVPLRFERVSIQRLRNIDELTLEPEAGLNVIVGDNGQGKTSLLEALYLVATTKSFRTERLAPVVQTGALQALVVASVLEARALREQRCVLGEKRRTVLLDGKHPSSLTLYATRTPVVVFHPADLELVSGSAVARRKLLGRVALYVDPTGAAGRPRYQRALRSRQRTLEERGPSARELDAFEAVMAEEGARLAVAHERAWAALTGCLDRALAGVAAPETSVVARYVAGGPTEAGAFARDLAESRGRDTRRGSASLGPQRDELELSVDGRPARLCASQGQQRLLTLALKLAELDCVRSARGAHPVLLLDDVSSELDLARTSAVSAFLSGSESQVFVTTTRRDLFPEGAFQAANRADFSLVRGRLEREG